MENAIAVLALGLFFASVVGLATLWWHQEDLSLKLLLQKGGRVVLGKTHLSQAGESYFLRQFDEKGKISFEQEFATLRMALSTLLEISPEDVPC